MKKLLLITGDLATGKSTFANILAHRFSVNEYEKDTIKEVLGDTVGFSDREENLRLSGATVELMIFIFKEFTRFGRDLILEANFKEPELEKIRNIAKEQGYDILILCLQGDDDILYPRYMHRMNHENRHPVHLSAPLDDFDKFKEYLNKSRKIRLEGNVIPVNANDFSYQEDEELLNKIDRFMKTNG